MDELIKKVYEAFGYDTSNPLRKIREITDEEALTIAKIFDNEKKWKVYQRKEDGQIGLKSNIFKVKPILDACAYEFGPSEVDDFETIYFRPNGKIAGPSFASQESYQLVNDYLISIGVERPILTKEKLGNILFSRSHLITN